MGIQPVPFSVHIPDEELARLKSKLAGYRLPVEEIVPDAGWDYGVALPWLKDMKHYWENEYNWRTAEAAMNKWPQFKVELDGVDLHFVHQKSTRADAIPLVVVHGWPGSFFEFLDIISALADPPAHLPAFHVVIPSVPGFGFSSTPKRKGWTVKDTAQILNQLMTDCLGYKSYAAQGGDWGSIISTMLSDYPLCKAVHLNMCTVPPPMSPILLGIAYMLPKWISTKIRSWWFTDSEWAQMMRSKDFALGAGYFAVQSTQPFTLGLALNDSPTGLLVWIGEKYHTHVDPDFISKQPEAFRSMVITTVSLYFLTQTFASSCLPYKENTAMFGAPPARITDSVLGVSIFEQDILVLPRSWIDKWHRKKLVFWKSHKRGGHFPALDNPDDLVGDIREMMGLHKVSFGAA